MIVRRGILACALVIGALLHGLGLYFLHNHPLHQPFSAFHSLPLDFNQEAFDVLKKRERAALLATVFDHLNEAVIEVKQELHELKPEFNPSPVVDFPQSEPFMLPISAFTLDSDPPHLFPSGEEGSITLWDSHSLVYQAPALMVEDLPIMTDLLTERDTYEGLEILAGSDHFDISVEYAQKQQRSGYVFKIVFTPKRDVLFKRIAHNYFFLIDRSNSIPRGRFILNKEIVSKALDYLKPKDTFNILFFDNKVCRLAETNIPWNQENVEKAREFLATQNHGGYFAATELYSSLNKIIPENVSHKEVNTAILLSDGDTYLPQDKQRQTIGEWTTKNEGKVSLFSVASGGGNNLPLLDLISSFNKGSLVYTYDHNQLPDRIADLMLMIRNPIGKNMVATAITADRQAVITLQPKNSRLPDLYQNRPFVIYGSTNRLSNFVLFLQGKYYDYRFDIKKHICFEEAQIGSPQIEKVWTQLIAQDFYERFFEDGNRKHIEAAKKWLAPLKLPIPFQE